MNSPLPSLREPVSLLMPVCNEADIIEAVLEEWYDVAVRHFPEGSEWIVDDASTDGTYEILQKYAQRWPILKVQHQDRKDGFFKAAQRLYKASRCPLLFFSDSDGQYLPSDFWRSVERLDGNDLVHSWKNHRKDPLYRVLSSMVFTLLSRLLFRHAFHDVNCVHGIVRRRVIEQLLPKVCHTPTLLHAEMLIRAHLEGYRIQEMEIGHRPRKSGGSKGLPMRYFARECTAAFLGMLALRREYRSGVPSKGD